ncbi:GPI inositol deacylase [Ceratobasidium sp. 370]|nr:GPI inositol deacylase [Ceratobasidium sp. 370]
MNSTRHGPLLPAGIAFYCIEKLDGMPKCLPDYLYYSSLIYSSPHVRSTDFASNVEPLDLYAVEFNEDLSALHGPTLQTQTAYVRSALEYIVSRYPQKHNLQITLLGHSMGGIVALNALESQEHKAIVSAVITMSSPHSLPPARLDREIERVFSTSLDVLRNSPGLNHSSGYTPPILAICGGATDNMLPMESCALPTELALPSPTKESYRRTIFTSGLDGTWTGVGHREMVWCHQVRWRVARAALELAVASPDARGAILDRWFAGIPDQSASRRRIAPSSTASIVKVTEARLTLSRLPPGTTVYHFPITTNRRRLVVMLARGRISGVAPEKAVLSEATVDVCKDDRRLGAVCKPVITEFVRLVPNPPAHEPFPLPGEGVDESEGVVVWEGTTVEAQNGYFAVMVKSTGDDGSWLVAGLEPIDAVDEIAYDTSKLAPFFGAELAIPNNGKLIRRLWLPNLISNALIVYRARFTHDSDCANPLLAPLLAHTSSDAESHFHRTKSPMNGALLHSHNAGPFLGTKHGINLTLYSSGECRVTKIQLTVDWRSSAGRAASRLWAGVFAYAVGVAAAMNAFAWFSWDGSRPFPTVQQSFEQIVQRFAIPALGCITILAILPLPPSFILGLGGEPLYFALAPITLCVAAATVGCSCHLLEAVQWILGQPSRVFVGMSANADTRRYSFTRSSLVFYMLLAALVVVFIPYQVAYLVAFLLHLWGCSVMKVQLKRQTRDVNLATAHAQASHLLLLLFWLLPLVAPVLIVWTRTLINAGITTPFDGDHNILNIAFIVMCIELGGSRSKASGSLAYQVTFPTASGKWYSGEVTNQLTWDRVSTDATSFTIVLTNQNRALLPTDQQLIATVDGTTGKVDVPAPSGGFPVGKGFRVNLVKSTTELNSILAQSPEFEIASGMSPVSSASTASMTSSVVRTSLVVAPTASSPSTTSDAINATGSPSTPNGAMSVVTRASPILGACAILAVFLA